MHATKCYLIADDQRSIGRNGRGKELDPPGWEQPQMDTISMSSLAV